MAQRLAKSQEDLKAEMSKGNEATAAMLEKIMAGSARSRGGGGEGLFR